MKNLVSIIIVNWNGIKWLPNCIESINSQTYNNIEVILVDNNSSDESIQYFRKHCKNGVVIANDLNYGFGVANNIGAKKANGDILLFLNNDTIFPNNLVSNLLQYKINQGKKIVGPRILSANGVDLLKGKYLSIDPLGYPGPSNKIFYVDGCCLMICKDDFNYLGKFDDSYFMYSEDIDLSWRAHLCKMNLGICETATIIHFGGGSTEQTNASSNRKHIVPIKRRFEVEKNTLRNLLKNYQIISLCLIAPFYLLQNIFESILYLITGNIEMAKALYLAMRWNIRNISDTIQKRKIVQRYRKVDDISIFSNISIVSNKFRAFIKTGMPKFKLI